MFILKYTLNAGMKYKPNACLNTEINSKLK